MCRGVDSGVDISWVYSQLQHSVTYTMFFFGFGLRTASFQFSSKEETVIVEHFLSLKPSAGPAHFGMDPPLEHGLIFWGTVPVYDNAVWPSPRSIFYWKSVADPISLVSDPNPCFFYICWNTQDLTFCRPCAGGVAGQASVGSRGNLLEEVLSLPQSPLPPPPIGWPSNFLTSFLVFLLPV